MKILSLITFMLLFSGIINANEFEAANQIVSGADQAGRSVLGIGVKWFFGVGLPLVCIAGAMIMGYMQQRKKQEQEQNPNKIYIVLGVSAIIGFFVFVIVSMIVSRALFGDMSYIFDVITNFWKASVTQ